MKTKKSLFKIGEVAKQCELSVPTIRYYEEEGLIKKSVRSEGGYRLYPQETIDQLMFVKKAQTFGLTLAEINKIMCCGDKGLEPCCDLTIDLFNKKVQEFEGKIQELQGMKRKLKTVLGGWVKQDK